MQPNNKTKIAMIIGAMYLGVSGASHAVTGSFDITITTIADLSVTQIQALSFGNSVFTTGSAVCNIAGNNPEPGDVFADGNISGPDTYLNVDRPLSGSGCAGDGRVGIYEVETAGALDPITVTVNGVSNADFTFTPNSNCLPQYGVGATDDACRIIAPGVPNTLAVTGDGSDQGTTANKLRFTVGGSLSTAAAGLTPNTPYSDVFNIDVIYQ